MLLDYWPLGRCSFSPLPPGSPAAAIARVPLRILLLEKAPLLLLCAASGAITFIAQRSSAVVSLSSVPLGYRIQNALLSYAKYVGKTLWPRDLAVFYPYPERGIPLGELAAAAALLAGVTLLAGFTLRRRPYLAGGWLWFLGMLVPMIGLVQVGEQAMADHYMYLPIVGLALAASWGAADLAVACPRAKGWTLSAGVVTIVLLGALTWRQLPTWKDSRTLFEDAIRATAGNALAENNLGVALANAGRWDEAAVHYARALRYKPDHALANYNLANILARRGDARRAALLYEAAIRAQPGSAEARYELGVVLQALGEPGRARLAYEEAVQLRPDYPDARNNLGVLFARQKRFEQAAAQLSEALRLRPESAATHANLANVLAGQGKVAEAKTHYQEALRLDPTLANARSGLAWIREREREAAGTRDGP